MPPKGHRSGRPEGFVKAVRLTEDIIERVVNHVERLQTQLPDIRVNEGIALRHLIRLGLEVAEGKQDTRQAFPTPPMQTQPAIPLALEPVPEPSHKDDRGQGSPSKGRPAGTMRQRILTLLAGHPEGLSSEQIRANLSPDKPIGDVLQGMRRAGVVHLRGDGYQKRYFPL